MNYKNRRGRMYTKKDQSVFVLFCFWSGSKIYHVIGTGNDVKQMESLMHYFLFNFSPHCQILFHYLHAYAHTHIYI